MTDTSNQQPVNGEITPDMTYWEVDIEYATQAKLVLMGRDETDVTHVVQSGLEIPNVKILSITPASEELITEAKARRAYEEAAQEAYKKQVN